MFGSIKVVNVRGMRPNTEGIVYVGRHGCGWDANALGNPFYMSDESKRELVISKYRAFLWNSIKNAKGARFDAFKQLVERYMNGEDLVLGCWCAPLACHADVLKSAIEWYAMRSINAKLEQAKVFEGVVETVVEDDALPMQHLKHAMLSMGDNVLAL